MAKELLIVFVYDCEMCKNEEDDPENAIIYFYPTWVNREQRHALCSQLMGVSQFYSSSFSTPRIISLYSGKFSIKMLGHYFLCVGTDRNIPDIVLETRSNTLYQLIKLFHRDIETLNMSLADDYTLGDKLTELFHVYMPILQFATNIFGNIPTYKLLKSASSLFLRAMHILQNLQQMDGVLGGVFLQQNKVIATQLSHQLTKQLVVTDPHRIKLPAENMKTSFHLPLGVQLICVYIDKTEVDQLRTSVNQMYTALKLLPSWRREIAQHSDSNKSSKEGEKDEDIRRSVSGMFTVREEDAEQQSVIPEMVKTAVRVRNLARLDSVRPEQFMMGPDSSLPTSRTTDSISSTSKVHVPIRYYSLGLPKMDREWLPQTGERTDDDLYESIPSNFYNTLPDPSNPLFKQNGLPCSRFRFTSNINSKVSNLKGDGSYVQRPMMKSDVSEHCNNKVEERAQEIKITRSKRDFKLPLNIELGKAQSRDVCGVPLTPLMQKLSMLASEEDVGLGTPLGHPCRPITSTSRTAYTASSSHQKRSSCTKSAPPDQQLVQLVLYVFGVNRTVILLLIDVATATNPESIHFLWKSCMCDVEEFLECLVGAGESTQAAGGDNNGDCNTSGQQNYSYLLMDSSWGPTDRAGPYTPRHTELLTDLHHTFNSNPYITDIILREEENVCYGWQCGGRQVYYQESCSTVAGLPPPSDIMGVVPVKAKRRLERDHDIVLFV